VATGDGVVRDMFYNGNAQLEPGAVVCRVARSFIRFGTFQLPVSRGEGQAPMVKQLADFVIRHHYSEECAANGGGDGGEAPAEAARYAALLEAVARRTGRLVAEWHRVGFVHGVLNTDNMSIVGDTIGACGLGLMLGLGGVGSGSLGVWISPSRQRQGGSAPGSAANTAPLDSPCSLARAACRHGVPLPHPRRLRSVRLAGAV